ncbi:MAG: glycine cleavage system aminomethyltransferase GcvT [Candidatus Limnocylindrales bacterium]
MARRHTPYYHQFVALGAEIVDRIGFDTALRFSSVEDEHRATRTAAGMYDVYYQGAVDVKGRDAEAFLNSVLVNDVRRLTDGGVLYSSAVNESGGMIDDLTVFRFSPEHYWLCPTPSRVDRVVAHLTDQARGRLAYVTNCVPGTAYLSIQGPRSREILASLTDIDLSTAALPYYRFSAGTLAEVPVVVSRTGYSGELGYELFYSRDYADHMWTALLEAGEPHELRPAGLAALRSVRIEKKYPLYGLDLDESTSPYEAGVGWTVHLDKGDFIGRDALLRQKEAGVDRALLGIAFDGLQFLPRPGDPVTIDGRLIGKVTSADTGYTLGRTLALGYLEPSIADGTTVEVTTTDGTSELGSVHRTALYDPDRSRVRA